MLTPHPEPVGSALAEAGIAADLSRVRRAHYQGMRMVDRYVAGGVDEAIRYTDAFVSELGIDEDRRNLAVDTLLALWGLPAMSIWRDVVPGTRRGLALLAETGIRLAVVSNNDGTARDQLASHRICQVGPGAGTEVEAIVDSHEVGVAKPDRRIFHYALGLLAVDAHHAVHVGDSIRYDLKGAGRAGITGIHFDPYALCKARSHGHVRSIGDVAGMI